MGRIRIGSDDHERRFCRAFVATFRACEPALRPRRPEWGFVRMGDGECELAGGIALRVAPGRE